MFLSKQPARNTKSLRSFSIGDVAIASQQLQTEGGSRYISVSSVQPAIQNAHLQLQQTEFDWVNNTNAFQRLKNLSSLENNWDGYGASRFTRQHIRKALDLFAAVQAYFNDNNLSFSHFSPFIAPCSDGAILFEWGGKRFRDRQLEIFVPATLQEPFEYEYLKSSFDIDQEDIFTEINLTNELLEWLFEPKI